jgi:integrase
MPMTKIFIKMARHIVARFTIHGKDKISAKFHGAISSLGTERSYRQCLANYFKWCHLNGVQPDFRANILTLKQYLAERSEWVKQKTLDQERQALQLIYKQKLPYLRSLQQSIYDKRSYTLTEVNKIVVYQNEKNAISTWLSFFAGIRSHEAATILPVHERQASLHRHWDSRRFAGLPSHHKYTVIGKGGLIREVAVPLWLANKLEARRMRPVKVVDREIIYLSHYNIGFGQSFSQSFSSASRKALGFSRGGHGLRHSFAKWRLQHLIEQMESVSQRANKRSPEECALLILSQELGHFRLDITYCYLR